MVKQAHSSEVVRCRFSLDGSRVVTVSSEGHKVGVADCSTVKCDHMIRYYAPMMVM